MKHRSPIRGYNHNIRYGGRLYHVQTEDSGVANPHIFTHLFHAGTILSSKRVDYDPEDDEAVVQRQMQAQHKSMLRDLSDGLFDIKIAQFFGERQAARRAREHQPAEGEAVAGRGEEAAGDDHDFARNVAVAIPLLEADTEITDSDMASAAEAATALATRLSLPEDVVPLPHSQAPHPMVEQLFPDTVPVPRLELELLETAPPLPQPPRLQTPARGSRFAPPSSPRLAPPPLPAASRPSAPPSSPRLTTPPPIPSSRLPPTGSESPPGAARALQQSASRFSLAQPSTGVARPAVPPASPITASRLPSPQPPARPPSGATTASRLPSPQAPANAPRPSPAQAPASAPRPSPPQAPKSASRLPPPQAPPSASRLPPPQAPPSASRLPAPQAPPSASRLPAPQAPPSASRLPSPQTPPRPAQIPSDAPRPAPTPFTSPFATHPTPARVPSVEPARVRSAFDLPPPAGSALAHPGAPSSSDLADPPHLHYTPVRVPAVPRAPRPSGVVVTRSVVVGGGNPGHNVPPGPPRRPAATPGPSTPPAEPPTLPTHPSPGPAPDPTIFGEDPYTDKSLDEVILAYLAEDSDK